MFEIVEEVPKEQLEFVEQCYLDLTKQIPEWFYNIAPFADNGFRGRTHSCEHKKKLSTLRHNELGIFSRASDKTNYSFHNNRTGERFNGLQSDFYNRYTLDHGAVWNMINGKVKTHKGWALN